MDVEFNPVFTFRLAGKELTILIRALKGTLKVRGLTEASPEGRLLQDLTSRRLKLIDDYSRQLKATEESTEQEGLSSND